MRMIYVAIVSMCLLTPGCRCDIEVDNRGREDLSAHSDLVVEIKNAFTSDPRRWHMEPSVEVVKEDGAFCATAKYDQTTVRKGEFTVEKFHCAAYGKDAKTSLENLRDKITGKKGTNSEAQ